MDFDQSRFHFSDGKEIYRVYPQRFWILFVFVFLASNQTMFWLTFSPIAAFAQPFYNISEATIDLLLNWGPIVFIPTLPAIYILLNTHHGLRKCALLCVIVSVIGTLLRLVPFLIVSPSSSEFYGIALPFNHIGQILIAATGPIPMASVSQVSCIWFAPHERTRATTVAILGAVFGGAVAFLVEPHLVYETWRVPHLLYMHAGQAILLCILTLVYFPAEPPSPPSVAASLLRKSRMTKAFLIERIKTCARDILHCCRNLSCILMVMSGAIMGGTFAAWAGLFATILAPLGYTPTEAGWFGFGQTVASIVGSLAMGYVADRPRFQRSFKLLLLISLVLCFIFCLCFQLSVRTTFWPEKPLLPSTPVSIGVLLSITGLFSGAATPLFYESLAEIMHPLPESLTTSMLVCIFNIITLCFLASAPNRYKLINLLVLFMVGLCVLLVACCQITYKRKDAELRQKEELENQAVQDTAHIS